MAIRRAGSLNETIPALESYMLEVPNQDNVKRIRADFNSKGKYMPTVWQVAKKRGLKQDEWKLALGYSVATPADHIELELQNQHFKSI